MLADYMVAPTLPVVDLERAIKFYEEKLGLKVAQRDPSPGAMLQCGKGTMLYLYQRGASKADHTVAAWNIDDIEAVVKGLRAKGVAFEEYDMPGLKTVNSIATFAPNMKSAWFKDTEGNILAVSQM